MLRSRFDEGPVGLFMEAKYGEIDTSVLSGVEYWLDACHTCQLVYQRFVPDDGMLRIVYDDWEDQQQLRSKKERNALRSRSRRALEVMAVLDYFGRDPGQLRVLDYGMGWGDWTRMAQAFGCEAFGFENAPARVEHARSIGLSVLDDGELEPEMFDFVNTEQVFEHLVDPGSVAHQLARSLKPGGVLRISVPNGVHVRSRLARLEKLSRAQQLELLDRVSPLQHVNCYTFQSILALGRTVGLDRVKIPARLRYRFAPIWEPLRPIARLTVGLHYREVRRQSSIVWLRKPAA